MPRYDRLRRGPHVAVDQRPEVSTKGVPVRRTPDFDLRTSRGCAMVIGRGLA